MIPFSMPDSQSSLSVTTTSGYVALTGSGSQILVQNVGSTECFIMVADTTADAEAFVGDNLSIPGNRERILSIRPTAAYLAAITASGTTTLRIARGDGS